MVPARCGYDPERRCLDGTREKVLQMVEDWIDDDTNGSANLLWIHGLAGSGKSSIASSIAHRFDQPGRKCLGASFFCKRDDEHLREPTLIIPTIVSHLATVHRLFADAVAITLRKDPDLGKSAIMLQFNGLIKGPLAQVARSGVTRPLVVIIDALDEYGTESTRRQLLVNFLEMSSLTRWLKIIVTSRPDQDIRTCFDQAVRKFCRLNLDAEDSFDDIRKFAQKRLEDIAKKRFLAPAWPGEWMTRELAHRASGLFVWVQTACAFIENTPDPDYRLRVVISADATEKTTYTLLDELYKAALRYAFGEYDDTAQIFRKVVGAVVAVATRTPLPIDALATLLEGHVSWNVVASTIRSLGSVLYEDATRGGAVRVCHPSFLDFLTDSSRSSHFFIDLQWQNSRFACICLRTMITGLKFNICQLPSSYYANADVNDLEDRIEHAIPSSLRYSSLHWASHVGETPRGITEAENIVLELKLFFDEARPLYWLEALSLLGGVKFAVSGLRQVVEWLQVSIALVSIVFPEIRNNIARTPRMIAPVSLRICTAS